MLLSLFFGMILSWCIFFVMQSLVQVRFEFRKELVAVLTFGIVIFGLSFLDNILRLILIVLFFVEFSHIYLKADYLKTMLSGIIGLVFVAIGDLLSAVLLMYSTGLSVAQLKSKNNYQIITYLLIVAVVMGLTWLFKKMKSLFRIVDRVNSISYLISIVYIAIIAIFAAVFSSLYQKSPVGTDRTDLTVFFIMTVLFFIINLGMILLVRRYFLQRTEYEQLRMYTDVVEDLVNDIRRFRHDYSNVVASMSGFIEANDVVGLRRYFEKEIVKEGSELLSKHILLLHHIKRPALKGILSSKVVQAEYQGIHLNLEISGDINGAFIRDMDLCRMIGILMDNAIEASAESDEKLLEVGILEDADNFTFYTENSYKDLPNTEDMFKEGFSTKGEGRGLGLSNLRRLIDHNYKNILLNTFEENNRFRMELNIRRIRKSVL